MNPKRLKYICYYDSPDSSEGRNIVYAATTKLDYIFDCLNRIGIGVDIVSFAGINGGKIRFRGGSHTAIGNNTLRKFPSFAGSRLLGYISRKMMALRFIFWFLTHVKRGEYVAVYHSTGYDGMLVWLKKRTGCKYIGEIEEIYQDVRPLPQKIREQEMAFINGCDKYLFPTELLDKKINTNHKPSVVIYGVYRAEPILEKKFDDGRIHVVYGGTFDINKGGAAAAAAAAAFLPESYHVHICGFGNKEDTDHIKKAVEETSRISKARVTFEGLKKGREYVEFIQRCHIGLSTQDPSAAFNATSFPSKVLVYLGNGLEVVSIDILAIRGSGIGPLLTYYHEQTAEAIADAIIQATARLHGEQAEPRSILQRLDAHFREGLKSRIF